MKATVGYRQKIITNNDFNMVLETMPRLFDKTGMV